MTDGLICQPGYGLYNELCKICPAGSYSFGFDMACALSPKGELKCISQYKWNFPDHHILKSGYFIPNKGQSSFLSCAYSFLSGAATCNSSTDKEGRNF